MPPAKNVICHIVVMNRAGIRSMLSIHCWDGESGDSQFGKKTD